jgi:hypothetical protein
VFPSAWQAVGASLLLLDRLPTPPSMSDPSNKFHLGFLLTRSGQLMLDLRGLRALREVALRGSLSAAA